MIETDLYGADLRRVLQETSAGKVLATLPKKWKKDDPMDSLKFAVERVVNEWKDRLQMTPRKRKAEDEGPKKKVIKEFSTVTVPCDTEPDKRAKALIDFIGKNGRVLMADEREQVAAMLKVAEV